MKSQPLSQTAEERQGCPESVPWSGMEEPLDSPGSLWPEEVIQVAVSLLAPSARGEGVNSGHADSASYPVSHAQKPFLCPGLCVGVPRATGLLRRPEPAGCSPGATPTRRNSSLPSPWSLSQVPGPGPALPSLRLPLCARDR